MNNEFHQASWVRKTNVYEVNLRQYTSEGTLAAFRSHLPRLYDMGVDVLWFMPITPISLKNRKGSLGSYYACSSYTKFNQEFGSTEEFKDFVLEAHQLGMKVIIDWVANHTGCDHEWTKLYPSFYITNNHGEFYDTHGWDDVIDLDYSNHQMRLEMIKCMQYWVDTCQIDGFRCDMAMLTPLDFWMQARTSFNDSKLLFWLAELDPIDNPHYMQVFDSAYTWKWMNATKYFKEQGAQHVHSLRDVLDTYKQILPNSACVALFTSNHDENSWNGTEYERYGEMAIPLAVFSAMFKGVPLLYSGQELPNLKRLAFFDKDIIEWKAKPTLNDFYKKLFLFRRENPVFECEPTNIICHFVRNSVDHHVFSFIRKFENNAVLVLINFSTYPLHNVEVEIENCNGVFQELFTSSVQYFHGNHQYFHLQPWGYQVWHK